MSEAARSLGWREGGVIALLLTTMTLGVLLRSQLAGVGSFGVFAYLRHAHSHLGYYGVLFPALWSVWSLTRGGRALSARTLALYGFGSAAAAVGFATAGYGAIAIPASTIVGAIWLWSAWRNRALASPERLWRRDWLAGSPIAVFLACCFIPFIAITTKSDPLLAQSIVRTFLGVLLFGAIVPAALASLEVPAPRALPYLLCALVAAVAAGTNPHPLLGIALVAVAYFIARAVSANIAPSDGEPPAVWLRRISLRGVWLAFAIGTAALGARLVPHGHATAVAALHFVVLGPLLCTFAWRRWPALPLPLVGLHLLASVVMVLAIYLGNYPTLDLPLAAISALSGGSILIVDLIAAAWLLGNARRPQAARSPLADRRGTNEYSMAANANTHAPSAR